MTEPTKPQPETWVELGEVDAFGRRRVVRISDGEAGIDIHRMMELVGRAALGMGYHPRTVGEGFAECPHIEPPNA